MAYHPEGNRPAIVSPFYLQWERYPYLRGPNYVRPMFREHSRAGNFRAQPIERTLAPPMSGLGAMDPVPWWCWDTPLFKQAHSHCWTLYADDEKKRNDCVNGVIKASCPWDKPPQPETGTEAGKDGSSDADKKDQPNKDYVASVTGFFKDKSGQVDPLKVGLAVLVSAIVLRQYKKGHQ